MYRRSISRTASPVHETLNTVADEVRGETGLQDRKLIDDISKDHPPNLPLAVVDSPVFAMKDIQYLVGTRSTEPVHLI